VIFRQFVDDDLGCASYLIGCADGGTAVVVDPAYRIEHYLAEAEKRGVRVVRVLETHTHADHVSGHGRLALEHGVPISVHSAAGATFPHDPLADGVEIYPGHVAGSLCGAGMSSKASSTIGFERRFNHALTKPDLESFVSDVAGSLPPRPPTIDRVVELNRGPFVAAPEPVGRLDRIAEGGVVLDVRSPDEFAAGHVPGALNVPVGGSSFATKAGFVLPLERPIVLHGSVDEVDAAAVGLRAVGFLELAGFLTDVPATERMEPVGLDEVERRLATGEIDLVDVREADERDRGYIPGSRHIPYRLARQAAENGLAGGKPVVTICESGARAAVAASVMAAAGIDARPVLHGGVHDWRGETVAFRRCG